MPSNLAAAAQAQGSPRVEAAAAFPQAVSVPADDAWASQLKPTELRSSYSLSHGNIEAIFSQPLSEVEADTANSTPLSFNLFTNSHELIGTVECHDISEDVVGELVQELFSPGSGLESEPDPVGQLAALIARVEAAGAKISSNFGDRVNDILDDFEARLNYVAGTPDVHRVTIQSRNGVQATEDEGIPIIGGHQNVTWVDVTDPDRETLRKIFDEFKIDLGAIEDCLRHEAHTCVCPLNANRFVLIGTHVVELTDNGRGLHLDLQGLHTIVGPNIVLTIHEKPCDGLASLRERFKNGELYLENDSAAAVYYQLAEVLIEGNQSAAAELKGKIEKIYGALQRATLDTDVIRTQLPELSRALIQFRELVGPQELIPDKIEESLQATGSTLAPGATRRWQRHIASMLQDVNTMEHRIDSIHQAHLGLVEVRQAEIQKKLAILAAASLPITTVASLISAFTSVAEASLNLSSFGIAMGVGAAISVGLLIAARQRGWM